MGASDNPRGISVSDIISAVLPPADPATTEHKWLRSSFCGDSSCVEIALIDGGVAVRDNKLADSPVLEFTRTEWVSFVSGIKNGEFDFV